MSNDANTQVLIPGKLGMTRAQEDTFVRFAKERLQFHRRAMGWQSEKTYDTESWLWKRHIATRMYANDFDWRRREGNLFSKVNMSLNMTEQFITHHHARMCDDLVPDNEFFGIVAEGIEDEHPAIEQLQRYLHTRARRQKLSDKTKQGLLGMMIRGEAVFKAIQTNRRTLIPVAARVALQDGAQIRTTRGELVTERDEWLPNPDDPLREMLKKDNLLQRRAGAQLTYSDAPKHFHEVKLERGSELTWLHYADFICPLTSKCLDDAEITGHIFEKSVFDLLDELPENLMNPARRKAYLQARRDHLAGGQSEAAQNREYMGEQEERSFDPDTAAFKTGSYAELVIRYSPHRNGRYERVYLLLDLDLDWPIHYDYSHNLFSWTDSPHPYGVLRIWPEEERWYGQGYCQRFYDGTLFADRCWCRLELELQKSGNLLFENPKATEEGKAGLPVRFRSNEVRHLVGDFTADDALSVKTVQPQTKEINAMMDSILQRLQASVGMTSANDPALQSMPAADTLGGMQMLQETSNVQIRKREDEALEGLNLMVQAWSKTELKNCDPAALAKLQGEESAALITAWLAANLDTIDDHIEVKTDTMRKHKMLQENQQIFDIMTRWIKTPAPYKEAQRPEYSERLRMLGVKDPERLLINPEMTLMEEGASPAAASAAVAGMPDPEQPAPVAA